VTKPLSLNEIRSRCSLLVADWRDSAGDERQDAQSFVRDLLASFGITETRAALYEYRAQRSSTGTQGYIDALVPGQLLIEMKSKGKNLALAEIQALDYMNALSDAEQPRYVLTCDFKKFRLLDLHAPAGEKHTEWSLEEMPRYADSLAFLAGYQTRSFGSKEQERASVDAAQLMAELYESLDGCGLNDHEAGIFLVRTLFALYADDAGVWPRDLFLEFLEARTSPDGSDLGAQLIGLFQVMNQPVERRPQTLDEILAQFPYVNGGIFAGSISIPYFDREVRELMLRAASFDWREISPAIFGSLFQAVKSPEARRTLGEHYTTETNIMKTLAPLFLDELREKFNLAQHDVSKLKALRTELVGIRVMDPACGSGNFLIVAYRELRQLELDILVRLQELGDKTSIPTLYFERADLAVKLDHVIGIEIEDWPAQIARTALRLVDHQANMAMEARLGKAPDSLPLDTIDTIHVGNALRMEWDSVIDATKNVRIVGNPPFVGMAWMGKDQQADNRYVFSTAEPTGKLRTGRLDFVANWFARAAQFIKAYPLTRAAFVSTNSITQGEQARTMIPLLRTFDCVVEFAHQTFKWTSEAPGAAAVHCVVVGLAHEKHARTPRRLFTYPKIAADPVETDVPRLNFYLVDGPDIAPIKLSKPLIAGMPNAHKGSQPTDGGHLILDKREADALRRIEDIAPYVKPFIQARDMLQGAPLRWTLWLRDASPAVLRHPLVRERLERVRDARLESPTESVKEAASTPARFTQDRQPSTAYFALPEVSSSTRRWIPGRMFDSDVIAGNKLIIFPAAELWHAALLQSSTFMAWVFTFAGRLKSDISISPGLAYFPVPWPTCDEQQKAELAKLIRDVFDARASHPNSSLADLYDPVVTPTQLLRAHAALDKLVDKLFGAKKALHSQEDRLALLFERYAAEMGTK
jgi:hypothetical protein